MTERYIVSKRDGYWWVWDTLAKRELTGWKRKRDAVLDAARYNGESAGTVRAIRGIQEE